MRWPDRSTVVEWVIAALAVLYFGYMAVAIGDRAEECRADGGVWQIKLVRCDYPEVDEP